MNIKTASKRFFKSPLILLPTAFFLLFIIILLYKFVGLNTMNTAGAFGILEYPLRLCKYVFIFFLFLSYEYFQKIHNSNFYEIISASKRGIIKLYSAHFFVMFLLSVVTLILFISFNLISYNKMMSDWHLSSPDYLTHILINLFVNVFLNSLCAIIIGMTLSVIFKRIGAYVSIIILVALVISSSMQGVASLFVTAFGKNIFKLLDVFNILPADLDRMPTFQVGYPVLPFKVFSVVFLSLFFLSMFFLYIYKTKRTKLSVILNTSLIALCVCSFVVYSLPNSKIILNRDHPASTTFSDVTLYVGTEKSEKADFKVISYDMDFSIKNKLNAVVKIVVDDKTLNEYKFTLWNNYKIKEITDKDANPLSFVQDGNYLTVSNSETKTDTIIIKYSGYSNRFFSNSGGTYLPGYFPYYPLPGYVKITNQLNEFSFNNNTLEYDAQFDIRVSGVKNAFSNIGRNDDFSFSGKARSATVMSGFLDEMDINGIHIIYPPLSYEFVFKNNLQLLEQVYIRAGNDYNSRITNDKLVQIAIDNSIINSGDTLIIAPKIGQQPYEQNMDCIDCFFTSQIFYLEHSSDMTIVSPGGKPNKPAALYSTN